MCLICLTCQFTEYCCEIFDVGVLLIGESGTGKSETALELVRRGHRLVADDAVEVSADGDSLSGSAPELTFEVLEVRGLGVLNVSQLFGPSSVAARAKMDLCIELTRTAHLEPIDRLNPKISEYSLLGVTIPKYVLPASSGNHLANLVETAVRLFLQKVPVLRPPAN